MKNRATRQMCECVNFTHYWAKKGDLTCSKVTRDKNGYVDISYKRCVLIDGAIDCPEYVRGGGK